MIHRQALILGEDLTRHMQGKAGEMVRKASNARLKVRQGIITAQEWL